MNKHSGNKYEDKSINRSIYSKYEQYLYYYREAVKPPRSAPLPLAPRQPYADIHATHLISRSLTSAWHEPPALIPPDHGPTRRDPRFSDRLFDFHLACLPPPSPRLHRVCPPPQSPPPPISRHRHRYPPRGWTPAVSRCRLRLALRPQGRRGGRSPWSSPLSHPRPTRGGESGGRQGTRKVRRPSWLSPPLAGHDDRRRLRICTTSLLRPLNSPDLCRAPVLHCIRSAGAPFAALHEYRDSPVVHPIGKGRSRTSAAMSTLTTSMPPKSSIPFPNSPPLPPMVWTNSI